VASEWSAMPQPTAGRLGVSGLPALAVRPL